MTVEERAKAALKERRDKRAELAASEFKDFRAVRRDIALAILDGEIALLESILNE